MNGFRLQVLMLGAAIAAAGCGGTMSTTHPTQAQVDYCNQQAASIASSESGSGVTYTTPPTPGSTTVVTPAPPGTATVVVPPPPYSPGTGSSDARAMGHAGDTGEAATTGVRETPARAVTVRSDARYRQAYAACLETVR
jgi:hypothetical protein